MYIYIYIYIYTYFTEVLRAEYLSTPVDLSGHVIALAYIY